MCAVADLGTVQRGRQSAQKPGQQRQTQTAPCTEHGPAVPVTDVLRQAVQVARVPRELEVNASHTCAQGNDAAGACEARVQTNQHSEFITTQ